MLTPVLLGALQYATSDQVHLEMLTFGFLALFALGLMIGIQLVKR